MFHHKLLFNLVKDLFKLNESLGMSVAVRVQSERKKNSTEVIYEKTIRYVVKFRAKELAI